MARKTQILRVAIATETRAEYWLLRPIYRALDAQPGVQPTFLASGCHHLARFGRTIDAIRADGFRVREIVTIAEDDLSGGPTVSQNGKPEAAGTGRSNLSSGFAPSPHRPIALSEFVPASPCPRVPASSSVARAVEGYGRELAEFDWLIVLGDRLEMLAATLAATALGKPIAHLHGGDVAPGARDDAIRHAITKLAHLHFPASADAARRIRRLGEQAWRIKIAGAPAIDAIRQTPMPAKADLDELVGFDTGQPFAVVLQHAAGFPPQRERQYLRETLAAVADRFERAVLIGPGLDAGSDLLHETIAEFVERMRPRDRFRSPSPSGEGRERGRRRRTVRHRAAQLAFGESPLPFPPPGGRETRRGLYFRTLPQSDYFAPLARAAVLVGNSSSGMIESGCFKLPVVDVGPRQLGRLHSCNVIHCDYGRGPVSRAIGRTLGDRRFRAGLARCRNLYGAGRAGVTIARAVARAPIDRRLLVKMIDY